MLLGRVFQNVLSLSSSSGKQEWEGRGVRGHTDTQESPLTLAQRPEAYLAISPRMWVQGSPGPEGALPSTLLSRRLQQTGPTIPRPPACNSANAYSVPRAGHGHHRSPASVKPGKIVRSERRWRYRRLQGAEGVPRAGLGVQEGAEGGDTLVDVEGSPGWDSCSPAQGCTACDACCGALLPSAGRPWDYK